jgi:hypothetical protein
MEDLMKVRLLPVVLFLSLGLGACGKGDTEVSLNVINTSLSSSKNVNFEIAKSMGVPEAFLSVAAYDMNSASELKSLKYIISSIQICTDATSQGGFGYTSTSGCVTLYEGPQISYGLDDLSTSITQAAVQQNASSQIDLMSTTDLAKLNKSTSVTAGTYNWAIVTWYPGIQFKAEVDVAGTTLHTKATTSVASGTLLATTATMSTGAAEETFFVSANGGAAFRFASPFVAAEGESYTMDMTFNPEQIFGACTGCGAGGNVSDGANSLYMPMLSLLPVPRSASESTQVETYLVSVDASKKIRIQLYVNSGNNSVYGVGAYLVYDGTNTSPPFGAHDTCRVTSVETNTNGSLKLVNNQFGTVADGIVRGANGTISTATTGGCGGTNASLSYTYVGTETL